METGVVIGGGRPEGSQPSPMLFVGVAGLAVVLALLLVALFPDSEPDPPPAPGGQSVVAADTTRWEAVHAALTQIRVEAPTVLPGGYELASLSQWRPRWSSTEAIWSWLLHGPAGSWIVVTADPATGGEAFDLAGFGLGGSDGDRAVLEWQDSGYTVRVVGSGVALTELQQVAAGIGSWEEPSVRSGHASVIAYLPAGFTVLEAPGTGDATVGPGEAGWRAGYASDGGGAVTLTAATDRSFPFGELFTLAPDHQVVLRGYWGLAFDHPGADDPVRSRLLWSEEGVMVEATSDHLSADQLAATIDGLDLHDPESAVMRTSTARLRLSWLGGRSIGTDAAAMEAAAGLLAQLIVDP